MKTEAKVTVTTETEVKTRLANLGGLHDKLADCHPALRRGQVWCRQCGSTQRVNSAKCLRSGWPKCCGYTMTIDHPDTHDRNPR